MTTKACTKCGKVLPADKRHFVTESRRPNGLHSWCKTCMSDLKRNVKHYRYSKAAAPDEVRAMVEGKTRCEICNQKVELVLDHCHSTNTLRGVLCHKCNLGLGHFDDDLNLMTLAMKYLAEHQRKLDR